MEFDENGRLILPENIRADLKKEDDGLVLTKIQVNTNNPAIAQLKIKVGKNIEKPWEILKEIERFCEAFTHARYSSVDTKILVSGEALIVEARSSLQMYSFLSDLIMGLKERMERFDVVVRGSWDKGGWAG